MTTTGRTITSSVVVVALLALLALLPAGGAARNSRAASDGLASAAAAKCPVRIQGKRGRWRNLTELTYKYKFKRVKGSKKFQRVIVRVKVNVLAPCGKRCVVTRTRRGKRLPLYSIRVVKVTAKRGGKIVKVKKRRRVYKYGKCPAGAVDTLGTPVRVDIKDGSYALLDFGAFQRQAPISGSFRGFAPGGIKLQSDVQVTLNRGSLELGSTPVFIDDDCGGQVSAAIRTGRPTTITLDPTRTSTSTLLAAGSVVATAYTIIKLPLELRNDDAGCDKDYITTGYTEFQQTFFLKGKVGAAGLTKLSLVSAPTPIDVQACLSPGNPLQPCSGFIIPLPIIVSTKLIAAIDLSGK